MPLSGYLLWMPAWIGDRGQSIVPVALLSLTTFKMSDFMQAILMFLVKVFLLQKEKKWSLFLQFRIVRMIKWEKEFKILLSSLSLLLILFFRIIDEERLWEFSYHLLKEEEDHSLKEINWFIQGKMLLFDRDSVFSLETECSLGQI